MKVDADKAMIFGSESGLRLYTYSFYRALPTLDNGYKQDETCDLAAVRNTESFIKYNAYNAETATSWSWGTLRNINYFIDGCYSDECTVDQKTRDNYLGIARWFRAYFYFEKLVKYGEVPWFAHEIQSYQYDIMYKDRDSRDVIIQNMIEDLDFAYEHIQATSTKNSSTLTKWAAAALKSRVCLFEASWRRYHKVKGVEISEEELYHQAADAAGLVIDNSGLSLNTASGAKGAYRD
ncbi:RagB/SusD family nutrient uptake outer membrane protein, partial [Bacteroides sp. OttesenSCG-928-M17]|nr:RagB/SusD family nutrient uptake outer membrane protein [Bacteroides sp. OttesenSCG-928-M17]